MKKMFLTATVLGALAVSGAAFAATEQPNFSNTPCYDRAKDEACFYRTEDMPRRYHQDGASYRHHAMNRGDRPAQDAPYRHHAAGLNGRRMEEMPRPARLQNEMAGPRRMIHADLRPVVQNGVSEADATATWLASSDVKTYYLALSDVEAAYPDNDTDMYRLSVREVPTAYYLRDVLIADRRNAGLSTDGYENYAYSVSTYQVRIERKAGVEGQVLNPRWAKDNTVYQVRKLTRRDYTADGKLLGEATPREEWQTAEKGSDYYALARGIDQRMYAYRPAGR